MALKWGSTTIGNNYTVKFNGTEVKKIYWGSTLVWEKASSVCSSCGGDGYIESTCYSCYSEGNGVCATCRGTGLSRSGTKCSYCLGTSAAYYCNGCGATIYVYSFRKAGTNDIDYSKSYTCGKCNSYYEDLDDVHSSCYLIACPNDVCYGRYEGACEGGYTLAACDMCKGDGNCIYCNGSGERTTACPVCNGGGEEGGDTSSD